jgi:uncharacterized membrane protein YkvA (DUF1232 family)
MIKRIRRRRSSRASAASMVRKLVRQIPALFKLVFRLLRDASVPPIDKVLFGAVLVYMLTPIDFMPDFLGAMGWVDDLYLLGLALGRLLASGGPELLLKHWDGDPEALGYLIEGVEEIGGKLPGNVRSGLDQIVNKPSRLDRLRKRGRRPRPVSRIGVDEDANVYIEE